MPDTALLRVYGYGGIHVNVAGQFLSDLDKAYNGLVLFEILLPSKELDRGSRRPSPIPWGGWSAVFWFPTTEQIASSVPVTERLILNSVRLQSPGLWEFLGALNPLEVLRNFINDQHERRKDTQYRESAERRRLELENSILESRAIRERVRAARDLGATDRDLAPLINRLVIEPIIALEAYKDQEVISGAEIRTEKDKDERP
jgi:hypothetical protein